MTMMKTLPGLHLAVCNSFWHNFFIIIIVIVTIWSLGVSEGGEEEGGQIDVQFIETVGFVTIVIVTMFIVTIVITIIFIVTIVIAIMKNLGVIEGGEEDGRQVDDTTGR